MFKKIRNDKMRNRSIEIAWHLLIPVLFITILVLFYPYRGRIRDSDEGINVIKGLLVNEGYELFKEIWSDQPPLYTYMLAAIYRVAGYSFTISRLSTVFLSAILMWACVQFLRFTWGKLPALIGAILLFLLPLYNGLSTMVMVGLPAISFAMVSVLFLAFWHRRHQKIWLILSGVFLGLSTLTKLFTGFLVPVSIMGLLASNFSHLKEDRDWRRFLQPAFVWGLSFSIVVIFSVLVFVRPENLAQLISPHLSAGEIDVYQAEEYTLWFHLRAIPDLMFLAIIGLIIAISQKSWLTLYPTAWMVTAFILLSQHAPVWSHQQLLVTLPAAILASIAAGDSIHFLVLKLKKRDWKWFPILVRVIPVILFIRVLAIHFPRVIQEFDLHPEVGMKATYAEMAVLSKMNDYADETNWIVTDMPIFGFWLQKPVPPDLAVISSKRLLTGNLDEEDIIHVILDYEPEQVLLGRFELPSVRSYLDENYELVHNKKSYLLYVRRDLIRDE